MDFSSLNINTHCVQDRIKTFLNTDHFKILNEQQSSLLIYDKLLNKRLDGVSLVVFNYHNLNDDETYKAYKRRCDSFFIAN